MVTNIVALLSNLPADAAKRLRVKAAAVEKCPAPTQMSDWCILFSDLVTASAAEFEKVCNDRYSKACQTLYVISLSDDASIETVRKAFVSSRNATTDRAFSRPNKEPDCLKSRYLYVGSSQSTRSRIKQHLGFGYAKTYALHISNWASGLSGGINIQAFKYGDVSREVLQILEDRLADDLHPMLGKRGAR